MKPAATLAIAFLTAIALLHALRLAFQVRVLVGAFEIPLWGSVVAILGPGALALWLWREQRS